MVLNNYWKALDILKDASYGSNANKSFGIKLIDGRNADIRYGVDVQYQMNCLVGNIDLKNDLMTARLGKGTGTIQPTDYALFDDVTSSFSDVQLSVASDATDEGYSSIYTVSGQNNTEAAITISEVGICKTFWISDQQPMYNQPAMFVKMLLENPITVPAGGTFQLNVQWLER